MANFYKIDYDDLTDKLMPWLWRDMDFIVTDDGDVGYGDTLDQDIHFILTANKGNFYQYPKIGLGIQKKQNATINKVAFKNEIIAALQEDGIKPGNIDIITAEDIDIRNITDPEILNRIEQDKFILTISATR